MDTRSLATLLHGSTTWKLLPTSLWHTPGAVQEQLVSPEGLLPSLKTSGLTPPFFRAPPNLPRVIGKIAAAATQQLLLCTRHSVGEAGSMAPQSFAGSSPSRVRAASAWLTPASSRSSASLERRDALIPIGLKGGQGSAGVAHLSITSGNRLRIRTQHLAGRGPSSAARSARSVSFSLETVRHAIRVG